MANLVKIYTTFRFVFQELIQPDGQPPEEEIPESNEPLVIYFTFQVFLYFYVVGFRY
jgi:hypothetical protein